MAPKFWSFIKNWSKPFYCQENFNMIKNDSLGFTEICYKIEMELA